MSFWEQFAIAIVQGLLAGLHVNPANWSVMKKVLLPIADSIYQLDGRTPPPPVTPAA